jgi:hypothetical protein
MPAARPPVPRRGILPGMTLAEYLGYFTASGGTDDGYLRAHWARFRNTKARFDAGWDKARGTRVLDVAAHWLHQSLLFALDGYQVTASDFSGNASSPASPPRTASNCSARNIPPRTRTFPTAHST